ncbi:MAG TPA: CoA-binding protein [Pseudonocardiaceae bacterium]|jgi:predicted CoA-binding protein|nr:CoA-binding protein [Pseudonocardiaceae bacterium]
MNWTNPSALDRQRILRDTKAVTLVGASDNPARPSFFVATYLLSATGFDVTFVNPRLSTLLGRPVYPSLADLPHQPDLVSVFRRAADIPDVADEIVKSGARTMWLQLGIRHEAAAQHTADQGLNVVMDRCVKIEHARFAGGLHLAGFNTGVVSSRRRRAL